MYSTILGLKPYKEIGEFAGKEALVHQMQNNLLQTLGGATETSLQDFTLTDKDVSDLESIENDFHIGDPLFNTGLKEHFMEFENQENNQVIIFKFI